MAALTASPGGLLAAVQPGDEVFSLGAECRGDLGGRLVTVAGGCVKVGSAGEKALGSPSLATVAGLPERLGDVAC